MASSETFQACVPIIDAKKRKNFPQAFMFSFEREGLKKKIRGKIQENLKCGMWA